MNLFFYLLLGLVIVYVELRRKRYFLIDHLSIFNFFFFLVYAFTPVALMYYGDDILAHDLVLGKFYLWKNDYTALFIFVSYLFFLAGYYFKVSRKVASKIHLELRFDRTMIMQMMPLVYIALFGMFVIYITAEGGLMRTIANAELYRGGVIFAKYGFLTRLFPLNQILLFYFYYLAVLQDDKVAAKKYMPFFILSMVFFFLLAAMYNSRGFLLITFLGLYIVTAMYHQKFYLKFLAIAGFFAFLVVKYADPLFHAVPEFVEYGYDSFVAALRHRISYQEMQHSNIIANFAHPLVSLETSLALSGSDGVEFRYFKDFPQAFLALIPSVLFGFEDPQYIMILNTELVYGEKVSIALPGILALFSYSLHFVGMLIGMFIYGMYGGFLSEFFKHIYATYKASIVFIYLLSFSYGYFVFRGSPRNALLSLFMVLVILSVIVMFSKISYKERLEVP